MPIDFDDEPIDFDFVHEISNIKSSKQQQRLHEENDSLDLQENNFE